MPTLNFSIDLPLPPDQAFRLGSDLRNLPKIQPGHVWILSGGGSHRRGSKFFLLFWQGLLPAPWWGEISEMKDGEFFVDRQLLGPFKAWRHEHRFVAIPGGTRIEDEVHYKFWGGPLGRWLDRRWVRPMLEKMFEGRKKKVREVFGRA